MVISRRAILLSANDSVEAIEAMIEDSKFPHIYFAHPTISGNNPTNPMGKLSTALLRLSRASGAHILPFVAGTELPTKRPHSQRVSRPHSHIIFGTDLEIKEKDFRKVYEWGSVVVDDYKPNLGGVGYILTGHIQQRHFDSVFCPDPKNCGTFRGHPVCKHHINLPLSKRLRWIYKQSRSYKALVSHQAKLNRLKPKV